MIQSKYWSIDRLPEITRSQLKLLQDNQINDTKILLKLAYNLESRTTLANQLQLNQKYINKWAALADLARLPSVGNCYCGLLLHSGIVSVTQLAQTPFYRLHRQIIRLQVATLQRKDLSPPVELVKKWVEEAMRPPKGFSSCFKSSKALAATDPPNALLHRVVRRRKTATSATKY